MTPVRRAEPTDAARLAALAERTFRAAFGPFNTPQNMDAHCKKAYGEAIQASEIVNPDIETFVCDHHNELVGYAQLRWGPAPPCVPASKPAEIQRIYVDQPWHGKGIAQQLISQMLAGAARGNADQVWLGVWENNPRAIAFYQKSGFLKIGHHVFQLGDDPQRDWILCRDVRSPRSGAESPSPIANALLAYLERHPEAEDTLEGIRSWWSPREGSPRADVSCALEQLVAEGRLVKHVSRDGRCVFRKPRAAIAKIVR